jgi:hypothetical protein
LRFVIVGPPFGGKMPAVERIVNKARDYKAAAAWDIQQQVSMSPQERIRVARLLQRRVFGRVRDVRAAHKAASSK